MNEEGSDEIRQRTLQEEASNEETDKTEEEEPVKTARSMKTAWRTDRLHADWPTEENRWLIRRNRRTGEATNERANEDHLKQHCKKNSATMIHPSVNDDPSTRQRWFIHPTTMIHPPFRSTIEEPTILLPPTRRTKLWLHARNPIRIKKNTKKEGLKAIQSLHDRKDWYDDWYKNRSLIQTSDAQALPTLQELPTLLTCCHHPSQNIFFCSLNYLTGPLTNNNDFKNTMSMTLQKYNPWCGRLNAYWWNQALMKQDDVQDDVLSTRTLFKSITAEGLLVKPGFDEAGRCPINKHYTVKAKGLLVKPDSIQQDDVL